MESVDFYKEFGDLGYLANYSDHGFYEDGIFYKTAEHYYQSHKFDNPIIQKRIIDAKTPKEASLIGRDKNNIRIKNIDDIKNQIMYNAIYLKFKQNKDIMYKLIETRNKPIREMTTKEYYWGIGPDLSGKNVIGKILVEVRNKLKQEILQNIIDDAKKESIVYIIGHKKPDIDSIFSSYLLSIALKNLGINAVPCILKKEYEISANDMLIINKYKIKYEILDDISDNKFILVDHNNLDGIPKSNIIGAIDHHIHTNEIDNVLEMEYSSTGLLVYDLFKNMYKFTKKEKELIGFTVLTDTEYLTSTRFQEEDKLLYNELNISFDVTKLQKTYFKISDFNDFDKMIKEDYKEYDKNGKQLKRIIIKGYTKEYNDYYQSFKEYINNKEGLWLVIWNNYESKETHIIYDKKEYQLDFFTTSTNLVLKALEK